MISDGPDGFMMIGLHKLAAGNGDGLVPELHALLMRDSRLAAEHVNVTAFPVWETRRPAREMPFVAPASLPPATRDNVVAFPGRPGIAGGARDRADRSGP
jgi:hypothetical protein